jgi:hypothetical protein
MAIAMHGSHVATKPIYTGNRLNYIYTCSQTLSPDTTTAAGHFQTEPSPQPEKVCDKIMILK